MEIYDNISQTIGNTPLLKLNNIMKNENVDANIFAKLEYFNPTGSVKDRIAINMIDVAEKENLINEKTIIVEPTSGNTGIGLASVCASRGYKVVLIMPETMSIERQNLLKAYGATIVLTKGAKGMQGAIDEAVLFCKQCENSFMPSQFENKYNPIAHYNTTAPEIWNALEGKVDAFLAGVGTGGTISGIAKYLKEKNPDVKIIAIEPADSPLLSENKVGSHKIQGIGANFVPNTLDTNCYDEVMAITSEQAFDTAKNLGKTEGVLVGISSGAALYAAISYAKRSENKGKNIVVLLPDSADRYMSTPLFEF